VLWACAALRHHPGAAAVRALGAALSAQLARLRPSELARAVAALAVLGHRLPDADVAALAARASIPLDAARKAAELRAATDGGAQAGPSAEEWAVAAAHAPAPDDVVGLLPLRAGAGAAFRHASSADVERLGGRYLLSASAAACAPLKLKFTA